MFSICTLKSTPGCPKILGKRGKISNANISTRILAGHNIVQNHEIVRVHLVVRAGPEVHPGVDFKVNMQNIHHKLLIL